MRSMQHDRRPGWATPSTAAALAAIALTVIGGRASAQSLELDDFLTGILRDGVVLSPPASGVNHEAHFIGGDSPQFGALQQVNQEMSWQLSNFPLSSSAGGFAYELDLEMGVLVRPTKSFGPIYGERPLTVGRGRFNLGMSYTHFSFDHLDDIDLQGGEMELVFTHADTDNDGNNIGNYIEGDVVTAALAIGVESRITSFVGSYGLRDGIDVGIVVPIVEVDMRARVDATVRRLSTSASPDIHRFPNGTSRNSFERESSARGVGDLVLRAKAKFLDQGSILMAAMTDLRLPTGDEDNLLGTGRTTAKMGVVGSWNDPTFSPHAAASLTLASGSPNRNELGYVLGLDWSVDPKLTLAADLLGRVALEAREVVVADETYRYNIETNPNLPAIVRQTDLPRLGIAEESTSRHYIDLAVGFKVNVAGNFLVTANGLMALADVGLRDEFAGLVGLDYSF